MSREAMQMALEAFDALYVNDYSGYEISKHERYIIDDAVKALRQALKQEPFEYWSVADGWVKIDEVREHFDAVGCGTIYKSAGEGRVPLYTAPKQWVGLTDHEIDDLSYLSQKIDESNAAWFDRWGFAKSIEAKLKEKNT